MLRDWVFYDVRFNCVVGFCEVCGVRKCVSMEFFGLNLRFWFLFNYKSLWIEFKVVGWCVVKIVVLCVLEWVLYKVVIV